MMKKYFLLVIVFLFNYANSQNSLNLKFCYKPENTYEVSVIMENSSEILYSGDAQLLKKIKEQGVENPTVSTSKMLMNSTLITGKVRNNSFPIKITYNKAEKDNGEEILPKNTILFGKCKIDSLPKMDSIVSQGMNESMKNLIFEMVNKSFSQIILPNQNVKIGEELIIKNPLSMPIGPNKLDMFIITKYKLTKIIDNLGYFDVNLELEASTNIENTEMLITGSGFGNLIYNSEKNIFSDYQTAMEMKMNFETNGIKMNLIQNTKQQIITILK